MRDLFNLIEQDQTRYIELSMSCSEIHNDKVHDLINPGNEEYDVREDENHNFYVKGFILNILLFFILNQYILQSPVSPFFHFHALHHIVLLLSFHKIIFI